MTNDDLRNHYRNWQRFYRARRVRDSLPATFARAESQYREDQNPRHVWTAYGTARAARVPIPPWVLAYLDRVAESMFVLNMQPPKERKIASAVAAALELPRGGRRNAFLAWPNENHQEYIAMEVQALIDDGHKVYEAAKHVGAEHPTSICRQLFPQCRRALSRATVESYYKRFARKA